MNKTIKLFTHAILMIFIFSYAFPFHAEAFWPYLDKIQAEDNEHITYQINTSESVICSGICIKDHFKLDLWAYYDDKPVQILAIKDSRSFEILWSTKQSDWFQSRIKAPSTAGEYTILFQGEIEGNIVTFSVPIKIYNSANPVIMIFGVLIVIGGVVAIVAPFSP